MDSTDPATAIIPLDLGPAETFDKTIFPLAYYELKDGDNVGKGTLLIKATLDEMERIKELGMELLNKNDDFIFNTRLKVEALRVQKAKLQDNRKSLNPFKAFLNYRAARLFHTASKNLFLQTRRTSEKIHREEEDRMQVIPTTQVRPLDDEVLQGTVSGIILDLPNGLNDDAKRTINDAKQMIHNAKRMMATSDPFGDDLLISQLHEGEHAMSLADTASLLSQDLSATGVDNANRASVSSSSLPTSPQTITVVNLNLIRNSIVTTNSSNLNGITHNQGNRCSGATQEFAP